MFSRQTLLAALAASAALMGAEAFSPPAAPPSIARTCVAPLPVSLSALDEDASAAADEEPADFLLSASELEEEEAGEDEEPLPARFLSAQRVAELRAKHRRHPNDTGSPEYQVAGMTERIAHLTAHLKSHPKDFSTRRGLVALVNKRRRLLNYLYREDEGRYYDVVGALGVRHKVPGAIPSREDQYGRFPGQKGGTKGKSKVKKMRK